MSINDGLRRWRPTDDWHCLANGQIAAQACVCTVQAVSGGLGGRRLRLMTRVHLRWLDRRPLAYALYKSMALPFLCVYTSLCCSTHRSRSLAVRTVWVRTWIWWWTVSCRVSVSPLTTMICWKSVSTQHHRPCFTLYLSTFCTASSPRFSVQEYVFSVFQI